MTQTPGFTDIKMHMKNPFKTTEQTGRVQMSKALSPHHYGETTDNLVKTRLLLESWAIYMARLNGWAALRACRGRHVVKMLARLKAGIRAADTREPLRIPLLENQAAHNKLQTWVPDLVQELLQSP
jgi:hypothetical protein